ncbi:sucrose permease [Vibrio variabilis]|uniref:Sucrose permease n=1 Tax=Vibrio variabilis TaxID=990271 RepID=A0ABQ0JI43_9VIBR|nr:sucrose permease [Vibrio variabilis]
MNFGKNRNFILLSATLFFFFVTWSFWFSLFPIWLSQHLGLDGANTGIIYSLNAIGALCLQPLYGYIQDRLGLKKHLMWFIAALLVFVGPFIIFIYGPLLQANIFMGAAAGAVYLGAAFFAGVGAIETYVERVGRVSNYEFGKARMWGSLGWAFATFFAGTFININPNINFWLASLSAVIAAIMIMLVKFDDTSSQQDVETNPVKVADLFALVKMPRFHAFALYIFGCACIYGVYDQQFAIYFSSQFPTVEEGNRMFGYLNSLQVFLEAGGMFLAPFFVNRVGAKNSLVIAGFIMATRIIGSGLVDGPIGISAMKLLHAVELPILLIAVFKYFSKNFDTRLASTLYLFGFQFVIQVFTSILSPLVGLSYDVMGFQQTYLILGCVVAVFATVSIFTLVSDKVPSVNVDENTQSKSGDQSLATA